MLTQWHIKIKPVDLLYAFNLQQSSLSVPQRSGNRRHSTGTESLASTVRELQRKIAVTAAAKTGQGSQQPAKQQVQAAQPANATPANASLANVAPTAIKAPTPTFTKVTKPVVTEPPRDVSSNPDLAKQSQNQMGEMK